MSSRILCAMSAAARIVYLAVVKAGIQGAGWFVGPWSVLERLLIRFQPNGYRAGRGRTNSPLP